ncbi:MAG: SRPBCC family protein [Azonexus sp.]|nr:SRPBCC family protein [Azonexus sp.]
MWVHEESIVIQAAPAALWRLFADVAGWPRWDASLVRAQAHGPFADGTRVTMQMTGAAPAIISTLREVRENESFTDEVLIDGHAIRVQHHLLALAASGTQALYRVEVTGPQAALWGERVSADFPQVLAALQTLAETTEP